MQPQRKVLAARAREVSYLSDVSPLMGIVIICSLALLGLLWVKWLPYYHRALTAFANHSIGHSILTGGAQHPPAVSVQAAFAYAVAYGKAIWQAMLLGLVLGSALAEFAPPEWIARMLGRSGWRGIATGSFLSIPGMMCTCCAAPVVIGLRRERATASSAVAFWLGNTLLNPATLVFMGFVLGWRWSALRLVFGCLIVFGASYLVKRFADHDQWTDRGEWRSNQVVKYHPTLGGWFRKFVRLSGGLIPEYLVLVLLLGASRAWLFPEFGPQVDNSLSWILLMSAVGLIFVIPTAGEVPIVQAMLALGVSAGPAAALLLTLPPVSLPSLVMTKRVFSARVLSLVVGATLIAGSLAGFAAVVLGYS